MAIKILVVISILVIVSVAIWLVDRGNQNIYQRR
jgi:preprotein translocase subunit SecE